MAALTIKDANLCQRNAKTTLTLTDPGASPGISLEAGDAVIAVASASCTLTIKAGDSARGAAEDLEFSLTAGTYIIPVDTGYYNQTKTADGASTRGYITIYASAASKVTVGAIRLR